MWTGNEINVNCLDIQKYLLCLLNFEWPYIFYVALMVTMKKTFFCLLEVLGFGLRFSCFLDRCSNTTGIPPLKKRFLIETQQQRKTNKTISHQ
jgi:hypothetical protein